MQTLLRRGRDSHWTTGTAPQQQGEGGVEHKVPAQEALPAGSGGVETSASSVGGASFLGRLLELIGVGKSVLSVFVLIACGLFAQKHELLPSSVAARCRNLCFKVLMPAFLMRAVWIVKMDESLYAIAGVSTVVHAVWFLVALAMARALAPQQRHRQGWLMLMNQGGMLAFLYPLLLSAPHLAERSLACAVLWDMGGNMWVCQGVLYGIADHFKGDAHAPEDDLEMSNVVRQSEQHKSAMRTHKKGFRTPEDVQRCAAVSTKSAPASGDGCRSTRAILLQPLLHICLTALILNTMGVAIPGFLDSLLWAAGAPFKPAMYFLVGYYSNLTLNKADVLMIAQALGSRYATATAIAAFVWLLPLERVFQETITLALYSPMTSNVMQIVGEIGSEQQLRLTVSAGFVSTITSTLLQNILVFFFGLVG